MVPVKPLETLHTHLRRHWEQVAKVNYLQEYPRYRNQGDQVQDTNRVVFVVDDEAVIAQNTRHYPQPSWFQASAFDNPEKAIAASTELTPALLISDVMMPGMTGVELAIHFRKSHPECKILLFSGQASTADLLERARADDYDFDLLSKPVHPADLLAKLRV
jgi:DNA-binding NtrC family response regulator